ncbi:hypothetical protein F0562_010820 [Nyssa sinensis]|uniref:EF-hand domain-containing protein n=1 Tax=Nyssa sinensis TaxID=561372 RepID=A0A5J5A308_9ASTE|nr:hypothetical protein F0562_010820 [Nyssa sinensis]
MQKPLIDGESGGSSRSFNSRRGTPVVFSRRSDAIAYGSPYQKAAALVDLAEDGVGLPEQILDQPNFERAAKFYFMFTRFNFLWSLNYFALIVLNFLEKPLWCAKFSAYSCNDREYYFLGQLAYLTGAESLIYEGITHIILMIHTFFPILYEGFHIYWRSPLNRLKVILTVNFALGNYERASSSWRECLAHTLISWPYGFYFFCSPVDAWIPAYKASRWYCLFFVLYVLLGVYFVTNLVLAVVYDSFKSQLVKQVSEKDLHEEKNIGLRVIVGMRLKESKAQNVGFLNKEQCIHLFEELNKYRTLPKISREDFELIFEELDDSHDFKINLDEFADLCNAIALQFQKEDSKPWFEKYPTVYHSALAEKLKAFVRSPKFEYIIVFILIMNLVAIIIETALDIQNNSAQKFWQKVEFIFGWLYVLEMALKIFAYGFENYWRDGQNRFDFIITWVIVVGETTSFLSPRGLTLLSNGEWIRYLILARMLRFIRLLMHVRRYRAFVATFLTLIPSLMPYLGTIFCVLCIYCSLGVQIFGGIVNAGNPNLEGTDLADNDYVLFNFNDYPNGMVTVFNLLVMNNWQVWMQVVAFVLEAFFAEMELETSEICVEQNKEAGGKGRRRSVGSKSQSQRVDVLLHHMLSAELNPT